MQFLPLLSFFVSLTGKLGTVPLLLGALQARLHYTIEFTAKQLAYPEGGQAIFQNV